MFEFLEHPIFTKQIKGLLSDDQYAYFQKELTRDPEKGTLIPGLSGLRKIRISAQGKGKEVAQGLFTFLCLNQESFTCFLFTQRIKQRI